MHKLEFVTVQEIKNSFEHASNINLNDYVMKLFKMDFVAKLGRFTENTNKKNKIDNMLYCGKNQILYIKKELIKIKIDLEIIENYKNFLIDLLIKTIKDMDK